MQHFVNRILVPLLLIGFGADAAAQSLAEIAAREKERRAKRQSATPVKSYGELELANAKGSTYSQMEGPAPEAPAPTAAQGRASAAARPSRSASSGTGRPEASGGEAYWRSRASQLRAAVVGGETRFRQAEIRLGMERDSLQSGCAMPSAGSISEAKGVARTYKCKLTTQADVDRAQTELDRARTDLERARQELDGLEDEARRARALPGWIR